MPLRRQWSSTIELGLFGRRFKLAAISCRSIVRVPLVERTNSSVLPHLDISLVHAKLYELNVNKFEEQKNKEHMRAVAPLLRCKGLPRSRKRPTPRSLPSLPSPPKLKLVRVCALVFLIFLREAIFWRPAHTLSSCMTGTTVFWSTFTPIMYTVRESIFDSL
eukprot:3849084-Pyramimonas_sp.AAC.2